MTVNRIRKRGIVRLGSARGIGGLLLLAWFVAAGAGTVAAVDLGDTEIILQTHNYYPMWNLTRLVYRVHTHPQGEPVEAWILEAGDCLTDEVIVRWASSEYERVQQPFPGLRFEIDKTTEHVYLWMIGQWDVGSVGVAVVLGRGDEETLVGRIDGPYCGGSSIAIEVLEGESIAFPPVIEVGRVEGDPDTTLRVTSTSSGWSLDRSLTFGIPAAARETTVERVFVVDVAAYQPSAGTTEIEVAYALEIAEEDLAGLPEGTYEIGVTYTVTSDN